jgi:hypothetical protein
LFGRFRRFLNLQSSIAKGGFAIGQITMLAELWGDLPHANLGCGVTALRKISASPER